MDEEQQQPIDLESLAQAIERIDKGMQVLTETRLKNWVIVDLLYSIIGPSKITKNAIREVLGALPELKKHCIFSQ